MSAYVQSASNAAAGTLNVTCAYPSNNVGGNFLIVAVRVYNNGGGPGTVTVTDTQGNTWVQAAGSPMTFGGAGNHLIFYCTSCAAGANTVSVACSVAGGSNFPSLTILEYSAMVTVSPEEDHNSGTGTGTALSSGNVTTTAVQDLLVAISSNVTTSVTETPGAGWTQRQVVSGEHVTSDRFVTPGTYSFTATDSSSVTWGTFVVAFKATALVGSNSVVIVMG